LSHFRFLRNWKRAKRLLSAIDHAGEDAALFEEVVKHIEEVDPTGQTFRYPESIKYDQHLKDWPSINLAAKASSGEAPRTIRDGRIASSAGNRSARPRDRASPLSPCGCFARPEIRTASSRSRAICPCRKPNPAGT